MVKVNVRGIIGACIPAISIILIFIAMFSNGWYTGEYEESETYYGEVYRYKIDLAAGLTEGEATYSSDGESETETEDLEGDMEDVGTLTLVFLIISLIIIFGYIAVGIVASFRLIPGFVPLIVGLVAAACLIFIVIYYPIAFPNACKDEGMPDELLDELSPGWAYFLTIGALVFLLPGPFMFIGIKRVKRRRSQEYGPPPMGYPSEPYGPPPRRDDYYEDRRRDDYYDNRDRRDYPPPRRDDYYHDRR